MGLAADMSTSPPPIMDSDLHDGNHFEEEWFWNGISNLEPCGDPGVRGGAGLSRR